MLIVLALVVLNGVFAGAEIAVLSVRKTRLSELLESGDAGARAVQALRDQPERFLATVQVGITVVSTTAAAFGGESLAKELVPLIARLPWIGRYAPQISLLAVVAAVSYLSLIFGELVPKSLALRSAERYALFAARPLLWIAQAARPLVWLLTTSSNVVLKLFGDRTSFTETRLSPDEIEELVEEAGKTGSLDARTTEITSRALGFRDLTAAAMMVPRTRMFALSLDATPDTLRAFVDQHRLARVPVYRETVDNVVGYIALADLLAPALRGEPLALARHVRPAHFVPATMRAVDLLHDMQQRRVPIALVVDETGGLSGLVTVEDLAEELFGDIMGESDAPSTLIKTEPSGTALVQGDAPIREVNRALALDLPEGEYWSTVAGLCLHLADSIPSAGARLTAPDGTVLEVVEATVRRVRLVRVHPHVPPPPSPATLSE